MRGRTIFSGNTEWEELEDKIEEDLRRHNEAGYRRYRIALQAASYPSVSRDQQQRLLATGRALGLSRNHILSVQRRARRRRVARSEPLRPYYYGNK